jgi:hypothetical protein
VERDEQMEEKLQVPSDKFQEARAFCPPE